MDDDPRRNVETPRNTETPTTRANKASAMRWAIGIAALFIVGVIAWWVSGIPRGDAPELLPQDQQEQSQPTDGNQPPAVIPNQDTGGTPPANPEPAGPGLQ